MSRVLRDAHLGLHPRPVGVPAASLPDDLRELLEAEARAAYERGRREGAEEARAAARADGERLASAVREAFARGLEALAQRRREEVRELLEMAVEIARHVLGREPGPAGRELVERVRAALEAVDDGPLELAAHPSDHEVLRSALAGEPVEVRADPSLAPGEVVLRGPWSVAELTREAAWAAVREALGLDAPR